MSEINTLDLKAFIYNAITEVFNTMLSMEVEPLDTDLKESKDGAKIVGSVSFAGDVMGSICTYHDGRNARHGIGGC